MVETFKSAKEALSYVERIPEAQGETMRNVPFEKLDKVRFGFIGLGGRGRGQLGEMLAVDGALVTALYDPNPEAIKKAQTRIKKAGQSEAAVEDTWEALCGRDDVDMVYICSPWELHTPQAVKAMECGKHAAVEVPCTVTLAECWELVDTSEKTRKHCMILENCCYGQEELLALNMIKAGLLGTITHGEAAYIHDLRGTLVGEKGEGLWRRKPHIDRNGNLYPTHGLGPVARYMDIHTGDRFTRLVSMSSRSAALGEYRDANVPADSPKREEVYKCGDMNSSLLQTAAGCTVLLQHDVVTPRAYSRLNLVQGSKGTFMGYPNCVYLDSERTELNGHGWADFEKVKGKYQHPLWKEYGQKAMDLGGHGGMDFIMNLRIVQAFQNGEPPDMDVYDAAAWSAPGPLSDISVAHGSLPLPFPDFTRGAWEKGSDQ